ncbi:prion-inhibition and propagation-domain-containing protein, partial [Leptodontidium sp. MPI-SDFR-AT-0119]
CVDCFEYVQFGRHFGRDFETSQLALDCATLRLTRWGESVNIYDDPKLGRQDATATEIQLAKDALLHVCQLSREVALSVFEPAFRNGQQTPLYMEMGATAESDLQLRQKNTSLVYITVESYYQPTCVKETKARLK